MGGVHGGQQPVVGARIYLFAGNTAGYGSSSIPLINPKLPNVSIDASGNTYVTSDGTGNFNLSGRYTCASGQQVYLLATGGNPGMAPGTNNPALALMSILGTCPADGNLAANVPYIYLSEVTTVASVYALNGFMTDATHVSSAPSRVSQQGMVNAFAAAHNLVDIKTGSARQQNDIDNGIMPQAQLNTLADILVPCINSAGTTTACSALFANSKSLNGSQTPSDTITATLNIARNPGANTATLFALVGGSPPFQPTLSLPPNDWSLALTFFSQNMAGPYFPAVDSMGNLWVPGYGSNALTEFDPTGNPISGFFGYSGGGLSQPYSIAIDSNDNPWVMNFGPNGASVISSFSNSGTPRISPAPCFATCFFMAFDAQQQIWISETAETAVKKSFGNGDLSHFSFSAYDSGIAIDSHGNGWTLGLNQTLYRLTLPSNFTRFPQSVTSTSPTELTTVAIDSSDNVWFASNKNSAIGKYSSSGAAISLAGGYTGGGLSNPTGIAVDGSDRVWVANRGNNSISAFANSGAPLSPATGYRDSNLSGPRGLVIDPSGNVWVTNFTSNSVTEFLGIATPVVTPISPKTHGQRP
jgi:streptogramin lyase